MKVVNKKEEFYLTMLLTTCIALMRLWRVQYFAINNCIPVKFSKIILMVISFHNFLLVVIQLQLFLLQRFCCTYSFHSLSWSIHYFRSYTWQGPVNNCFCNNFSIRGINLTTIMPSYLLLLNALIVIRGAGINADKNSVLVQLIYLETISVRCTIVLAVFKSFSFRDCSSDSYFITCSL